MYKVINCVECLRNAMKSCTDMFPLSTKETCLYRFAVQLCRKEEVTNNHQYATVFCAYSSTLLAKRMEKNSHKMLSSPFV